MTDNLKSLENARQNVKARIQDAKNQFSDLANDTLSQMIFAIALVDVLAPIFQDAGELREYLSQNASSENFVDDLAAEIETKLLAGVWNQDNPELSESDAFSAVLGWSDQERADYIAKVAASVELV